VALPKLVEMALAGQDSNNTSRKNNLKKNSKKMVDKKRRLRQIKALTRKLAGQKR